MLLFALLEITTKCYTIILNKDILEYGSCVVLMVEGPLNICLLD